MLSHLTTIFSFYDFPSVLISRSNTTPTNDLHLHLCWLADVVIAVRGLLHAYKHALSYIIICIPVSRLMNGQDLAGACRCIEALWLYTHTIYQRASLFLIPHLDYLFFCFVILYLLLKFKLSVMCPCHLILCLSLITASNLFSHTVSPISLPLPYNSNSLGVLSGTSVVAVCDFPNLFTFPTFLELFWSYFKSCYNQYFQMTVCIVEGVAPTNKWSENYHPTVRFPSAIGSVALSACVLIYSSKLPVFCSLSPLWSTYLLSTTLKRNQK